MEALSYRVHHSLEVLDRSADPVIARYEYQHAAASLAEARAIRDRARSRHPSAELAEGHTHCLWHEITILLADGTQQPSESVVICRPVTDTGLAAVCTLCTEHMDAMPLHGQVIPHELHRFQPVGR